MRAPVLIVFVREVVAGRAKTRLGRDIGMTRAAWWQRHQVRGLLRRLRDPRWRIVLAVTPDAALRSAAWPVYLPRMPQGEGDLGKRMTRALRRAGPGRVLLIGSDLPHLDRRHIAEAFASLGSANCVLCPARDGGFWAVGYRNGNQAKTAHMEGVRWSGPHAMTDTAARLPGPVVFGPIMTDVDTGADLALLRQATA